MPEGDPGRETIALTTYEPKVIRFTIVNTQGRADDLCVVCSMTFIKPDEIVAAAWQEDGQDAIEVSPYAGAYGMTSLVLTGLSLDETTDKDFTLTITLGGGELTAARGSDADLSVRSTPEALDVLGTKGLMFWQVAIGTEPDPDPEDQP